jgi:hypothetical protein
MRSMDYGLEAACAARARSVEEAWLGRGRNAFNIGLCRSASIQTAGHTTPGR